MIELIHWLGTDKEGMIVEALLFRSEVSFGITTAIGNSSSQIDLEFHGKAMRRRKHKIEEGNPIPGLLGPEWLRSSSCLNETELRQILVNEGAVHPKDLLFVEENCIPSCIPGFLPHNPNDDKCVCNSCCEKDYWDSVEQDWKNDWEHETDLDQPEPDEEQFEIRENFEQYEYGDYE